MSRDLTPKAMRCEWGGCPAIYEATPAEMRCTYMASCPAIFAEDGAYLIIGKKVETVTQELLGRIGPDEMLVAVPKRLIDEREQSAEAIASLQGEVEKHIQHKRDAYEAVKEALSLCQHTPDEWLAMAPELAAFKLAVFGVLEMRCLNLGYGVRAAISQHPGEGE